MNVLFALVNFGITLGYLFVAVAVLPNIDVRRWWVRWSAIMFFLTCGITHGEMAVYALLNKHHIITLFSAINHTIQVVAVWFFVVGLYLEFVQESHLDSSDVTNSEGVRGPK